MELMIDSGNFDALEGLIEQASQTRAQWRMGASKTHK
jgi:prephenate dehydrogenase